MTDVVGGVLLAGAVVFTVGAVRWRLEYERPLAESLPMIHADRGRRAWIQTWMLAAMFVTTAGVAGFTAVPDDQLATMLAAMAASAYALGAVSMIVSLAFGLTVVPWAAERTVSDGSIPEGFPAYRSWSSGLYVIHMVASYATFAALGAAVLASDVVPEWVGWTGLGLGVGCLAGFVATRFAGPFNPPILAHTYTGLLGAVLLFS